MSEKRRRRCPLASSHFLPCITAGPIRCLPPGGSSGQSSEQGLRSNKELKEPDRMVSLPTTSEMDEMGHRRAKRGSSGPASGVAVRITHLRQPRALPICSILAQSSILVWRKPRPSRRRGGSVSDRVHVSGTPHRALPFPSPVTIQGSLPFFVQKARSQC